METSPLGLTPEPYLRLFAAVMAAWIKDARNHDHYERQTLAHFLEVSDERLAEILARDHTRLHTFAHHGD